MATELIVEAVDLKIAIQDGDVGELQEAIKRSPFPASLKRLLWWEILDPFRTPPGKDGIVFCEPRATSLAETGQDVVVTRLGRAGKAWVAAFRALRPVAHDVDSHETDRS